MAKLKELLVDHITEWPDGFVSISQNPDGELIGCPFGKTPIFDAEDGFWHSKDPDAAEDCDRAVVTKADWEEARRKALQ